MNRSRLWAAVLVVMLGLTAPVVSEAKTPGRNGNESDFKDWQPSRGQVSTEESAAGVAQTPAQRKSEDRELQQLYNGLLRQEQCSRPSNAARLLATTRVHHYTKRGTLMTRTPVTMALSLATVVLATAGTANAQQRSLPRPSSVTAYVVMTPNGPATCATWTQWRGPGANPADKEIIQYWAEGYISGLAAGSRHDVLGQFQLRDLGAWLDRYCAANPQTKLPLALNALGREMLAHPGGKL